MDGKDALLKRLETLESYTSDLEKYLVTVRSEIADLKKAILPNPPSEVVESERPLLHVDPVHETPPILIEEAAVKGLSGEAALSPNKFNSEAALRNTGVALFLLGVGFFFKYAIEHSLITPALRVAIGLATGAAMLKAGLYTHSYKRRFAQIMLGGGVATLYISIFSGYNFYGMFGHPLSLAAMTGVTILAFALAIRKGERMVALVAAAGGLMTPFVLSTDMANIPGLVGYILFVFVVSSSIYFFKGWRPLLAVSSYGGWGAMGIASSLLHGHGDPATFDLISVLAGGLFLWMGCWLSPNSREALAVWKSTRLGQWALNHMEDFQTAPSLNLASSYAISSSVFLVLLIGTIPGRIDDWKWGLIFLALATAKGSVGWLMRSEAGLHPLLQTHKVLAVIYTTMAIWNGLHGDWRIGALVAEGLALLHLYLKYDDRIYEGASYIIFALTAIEFVDRAADMPALKEGQWAFLNLSALFNILIIATWIYASVKYRDQKAREWFWVFIHFLFIFGVAMEINRLRASDEMKFDLTFAAVVATGLIVKHIGVWVRQPTISTLGDVNMAFAGMWLGGRLGERFNPSSNPLLGGYAFLNFRALVEFAGMAAVVASRGIFKSEVERRIYLSIIHILFLYWIWVELRVYPDGEVYTSLAWGALGIGALVAGLTTGRKFLFSRGTLTLFIVASKLLAVDMQTVSSFWKILLFTGFGALFLGVSYLYKQLAARSAFSE